jgi:anti-anti-sigma factor
VTVETTRHRWSGAVTIDVRGDLDVDTTGQLRAALVRAVLRTRSSRVIVDLRSAGWVAPEGVGAIVAAQQLAAERGLPLVVRRPQPQVAARLCAAGLPRTRVQRRSELPNSHFTFWLV